MHCKNTIPINCESNRQDRQFKIAQVIDRSDHSIDLKTTHNELSYTIWQWSDFTCQFFVFLWRRSCFVLSWKLLRTSWFMVYGLQSILLQVWSQFRSCEISNIAVWFDNYWLLTSNMIVFYEASEWVSAWSWTSYITLFIQIP